MPGSFDDVLRIRPDGCLSPTGPTGLAPDEIMVRLDFWVIQKAACMDVVRGGAVGQQRWDANPDHHTSHFGPHFEPGPAIAMGLMVKRKDGSDAKIVEQWSRAVTLK